MKFYICFFSFLYLLCLSIENIQEFTDPTGYRDGRCCLNPSEPCPRTNRSDCQRALRRFRQSSAEDFRPRLVKLLDFLR